MPDKIFFPDPKNSVEFHADHINVGVASANAFMNSSWEKINKRYGINETFEVKYAAMYYSTSNNTYVKCKKFLPLKFKAFECFKSQFKESDFKTLESYFKLNGFRQGFIRFSSYVEGYKILSGTLMHCVPEASKYF